MRYVAIFIFALQSLVSWSQCPTCTPDQSCVSPDGQPTVCPETLPVAFTGEYYEQVLTFYMPATVLEPELNVTVTLNQITITSVTGLPFGLSYTTNNADGIYFPSQGENHGCATICGTPLVAGVYDVLINVAVLASVAGFEVNQNQSFTYSLVVEQGSTSTSSFTVDNTASCGSLTSSFEATLAGTEGQVTTYNWNLGNGEFSNAPTVTAEYNQEGEYEVSLTTVISEYVLNEVNLGNINGNGDGDVDEFFSGPADPYFTLADANGNVVYTSSTSDNTTSVIWGNLNLVLSESSYTITFWDEDDVTQDDVLSIFNVSLGAGQIVFNSGDGTIGTFTINLVETLNITDTVTVTVISSPEATISAADSILSVAEENAASYQWFFNGDLIVGANGQTYNADEGGTYTCVVVNNFGCESTSEPFTLCLPVTPVYDDLANEIYVDNIYETYQWSFNGLPLEGATDFFIVDPPSGNYGITVTTDYGCEITGSIITVVNSIDNESLIGNINLYPNPTSGVIWLDLRELSSSIIDIEILSLDGKIVLSNKVISAREILNIDLSNQPSGAYLAKVTSSEYSSYHKVIKN